MRKIKARHQEALVTLMGHFPNKKELEDWIHAHGRQIHSTRDKLASLKYDSTHRRLSSQAASQSGSPPARQAANQSTC